MGTAMLLLGGVNRPSCLRGARRAPRCAVRCSRRPAGGVSTARERRGSTMQRVSCLTALTEFPHFCSVKFPTLGRSVA